MIKLESDDYEVILNSNGIRIVKPHDENPVVIFRCGYDNIPDITYEFVKVKGWFKSNKHIFHLGDKEFTVSENDDLEIKALRLVFSLLVLKKHNRPRAIELVGTDDDEKDGRDVAWDDIEDEELLAIEDEAFRLHEEDKKLAAFAPSVAPQALVASPATPASASSVAATPPPPAAAVFNFFAMIDGKQQGPYDEAQFGRLVNFGIVTRETYVWCEGMAEWKPAGDVERLQKLMGIAPPPPPMPGM